MLKLRCALAETRGLNWYFVNLLCILTVTNFSSPFVYLQHHEQVRNYIATLETLLFTRDVDVHILEVFQQFCALYS
jgi:hypothetical protein